MAHYLDDNEELLTKASTENDIKMAETALQKGAKNKEWAIHNAAEHGNVEMIEFMFSKKSNPKYIDIVLIIGCEKGNMRVVDYALNKGGISKNGFNSGFVGACQNGHLELVKLMMYKHENAWPRALYVTFKNNQKEVLKILMQYPKCIEFMNSGNRNIHWNVCLWGACEGGHRGMADIAIDNRADEYEVGLYQAASHGQLNMVKYMIQCGATDLDTAMMMAAREGYMPIVEYLVSQYASDWNYALREAAKHNKIEMVEYMLKKGADEHDDISEEMTRYLVEHDYVIDNKYTQKKKK